MKHKKLIISAVLLVGAIVAVITNQLSQQSVGSKVLDTEIVKMIDQLPKNSGETPNMRIVDGLIAPTNSWISSVVFSTDDQPVFAYPLTFKPSGTIQEIGTQTFTATEKTMMGVHDPTIKLNLGSQSYKLKSYDDFSAEIAYFNGAGDEVADVRVTRGSPYVFIHPSDKQKFDITVSAGNSRRLTDDKYEVTAGEKRFGIFSNGQKISLEDDRLTVLASDKSRPLVVFAIPKNSSSATFFEHARNTVQSSQVSYRQKGKDFETIYQLTTSNGQPTYFASMPHHNINTNSEGAFDGLYGRQELIKGNQFTSTNKAIIPESKLDISQLSNADKDQLRAYLKDDISATTLQKTDTYFGSKELYRASNLLALADELGMTVEKSALLQKLNEALDQWLTPKGADGAYNLPRSFYYDTAIKGIVGSEPSFGSEEFNDHHFHYGYFIYTASLVARYDDTFSKRHGAMVNALVEDIAARERSEYFPKRRVFDNYMGHSWASGYSNFGDGNNQESSSEAVNAWNAVYQWADATSNDELKQYGLWLYNQEVASAKQYWLSSSTDNPAFSAYKYSIAVLNWGGKRDYATFFSPRPQAMLGIQLIPMSPGHKPYLSSLSSQQRQNQLSEAAKNPEDYLGQFGDYMTMYQSLDNPELAKQAVEKLPASDIDDANSRSYMYAWVASH